MDNWVFEVKSAHIQDLLGLTLTSVTKTTIDNGDAIIFTTNQGRSYALHHWQDCCESVYIEDINGDLTALVGSPLLLAEEVTNRMTDESGDSFTWTFYKFATIKGYVDIRWCGTSNGYYSESVDFNEVKEK